jgi:multiple antibiotic resistance protein
MTVFVDVLAGAGASYAALVAVVNPFSTLPVFSALSHGHSSEEKHKLAWRTSLYSFWILLGGLLVGRFVLHFLGISLGALEIAGGGLVVLAGWRLLQMNPAAAAVPADERDDPAFAPLAMPISAGPGALGVVLGVATRADDYQDYPAYAIGILLVAATLYVTLRFGDRIVHRMGPGGMRALNQIVGFVVIAIGAELIMHGAIVTGPVYHSYQR